MSDFAQTLHTTASIADRLAEKSRDIEAARRVPAEEAAELAKAGAFRMLVPKSLGGLEARPAQMVELLERLGRGDGAAAWCVMTGSTTAYLTAYLDPEVAAEIAKPDAIMAGVFAPRGRLVAKDDGFDLSGRWSFTSGCDNAQWLSLGALVMEDGRPAKSASGGPQIRSVFIPASEALVHDTWHTSGLRGTGSHDVEVAQTFVPSSRTCVLTDDAPRHDGRLYKFPAFGLLASGVAGVALGIARSAIDDMSALAKAKKGHGGRAMAGRGDVQVAIATAEGEWMAGRAGLIDQCERCWAAAEGGALSVEDRARLRIAAAQAVRCAVRAVDAMYELGGGTSIYESCSLQRHFRDVHTVTQHIMVAAGAMRGAGGALLGTAQDTSQL